MNRGSNLMSALRKANKAAVKHRMACNRVSELFEARYGKTYSDMDCDPLIDAVDLGMGEIPDTIEELDAMVESYCHTLPGGKDTRD